MSKMSKLFNQARLVSVPIVTLNTIDQFGAVAELTESQNAIAKEKSGQFPIVQWDAARGISAVNDEGAKAIRTAGIKTDDTFSFYEAMMAARLLPRTSIIFVHNAHRQLQSAEPSATAQNVQAVANTRDEFKQNFRMLVLMGPNVPVPVENQHDVVIINDELPNEEALRTLVKEIFVSADRPAPDETTLSKCVDALSGLSLFSAEQALALSLTEDGIDYNALWDRKRATIEQTPGLSVYRGTETFDSLRGLDSIKKRLRQHIGAKTNIGVVVWIDEGADVFSNVENDTSGVKTDQQRGLLVAMEQNGWRGVIVVGVPGAGKSGLARAFGNEAGVPTIELDLGGMQSKWVGESEQNMRQGINVIESVGRGNAFFFLTCNSLKGIRPQFQRRFKRGVFFFDLPTKDERTAIWNLYLDRFQIEKQPLPKDDGWTGAEIKECCESAWDTGISLVEAAQYIIPVSRSRGPEIEEMRKEAHHRFLDASKDGPYVYAPEPMKAQLRAIAAPGDLKKLN